MKISKNIENIFYFVHRKGIVLQKHTPRCVFCSRSEALVEYHNRRVCASCMRELSAMGGGTKVARRRTED